MGMIIDEITFFEFFLVKIPSAGKYDVKIVSHFP